MADADRLLAEVEALRARNRQLEQELSEARQTIDAFMRSDVDPVPVRAEATPILLQHTRSQLRRNESLLRALFDSSMDALLLADDAGAYVDANPAACQLFKIPREQLIGRRISEFAAPGHESEPRFRTFLEEGRMRGQFPLRTADGSRRILDFSAVANVAPGLHLSSLRDVTERVVIEEELRRSEARFRSLTEKSADGVAIFAADGTILYLGPSATRILGYPPEALLGHGFGELIFEADRERALAAFGALQHVGENSTEFRVVRKDGEVRWLEASGTNLLHDRDVRGVVGNFRDITDRKRADDELRESRRMLEEAQAIAHVGSWSTGPGLDAALAWSRETYRIFGIPEGTPMSVEKFYAAVHPDDRDSVKRAADEAWERGESYAHEHRILRPGGAIRWTQERAEIQRVPGTGAVRMFGTVQDVTERHLADEALRRSEERYRRIVDNSSEGIWMYDAAGVTTFVNPQMARLLGCSPAEAVGQPVSSFIEWSAARSSEAADWQAREVRLRRRDGTEVWVSISADPLLDAQGLFESAVAMVTDVTAQRRAQLALRRSEEQLRQAQKMEAVGNLAGGIAHDFNNLLSVILSYTTLILDELRPADPLRAELEEVQKAGLRASELTRQLLAFSRKQMLQPTVLVVNQVLLGLEKMLRRVVGEHIDLSFVPSPQPGKINADLAQLEQVIMNLVVNARDAMPQGGNLTIETSNLALEEPSVGLAAGNYVLIAVSDNGVGMDRATQERIFEPFFTTKDKSKGTGLGLSTVYGIVQQSNGYISVYSEPGKGTTFKVYFPRTDLPMAAEVLRPEPTSLRGTETVLLVEDEEQVRTIMRTILRKSGYHVVEAQNAGEAFLISEQFGARIHLLLTDVVMPRMSGRQLADRLCSLRPDLKVLFVSGYTETSVIHNGTLDAGIEFMSKPVMPEALLRKVRQLLDRAPAG